MKESEMDIAKTKSVPIKKVVDFVSPSPTDMRIELKKDSEIKIGKTIFFFIIESNIINNVIVDMSDIDFLQITLPQFGNAETYFSTRNPDGFPLDFSNQSLEILKDQTTKQDENKVLNLPSYERCFLQNEDLVKFSHNIGEKNISGSLRPLRPVVAFPSLLRVTSSA